MRYTITTPALTSCCVALGVLCLLQTGCSVLEPKADNTRLYVLRPTPVPAASVERIVSMPVIRVGPGRVAPYLDVTPLVVQDGSNRVRQLDTHHWAEPLPKGISRVFGENLTQRLNGVRIIQYPEPVNDATLEVRYTVSQLEGEFDGPLSMQVAWQVVEPGSGETLCAGKTTRDIAAARGAGGASGYVESISRGIGIWADDVATAIRALPGRPPAH